MRVSLFCHSVISDWNNGNAHFTRGVAAELLARGHEVVVYEPRDAWSLRNQLGACGRGPLRRFWQPDHGLIVRRYSPHGLDLDDALRDVDLAIVHEWNGHDLVRALGRHRQRRGGYRLLFHDTHHRSLTAPKAMAGYSLCHYDGVLAFGSAVRDRYLEQGWALRAWTWHEAADTRLFYPRAATHPWGDLVWIGNWGDGERTRELNEFLLRPVAALGLRARAYGVRYPAFGRDALARARIGYGGWLANHAVPEVLAHYRVTVHVPRAPYARALAGIPTIRVFEALACGVPLVCSPWEDSEGLFRPGEDYLVARDGNEMAERLHAVLSEEDLAASLARHGRATVLARHTCAHRVDELLAICAGLGVDTTPSVMAPLPAVLAIGAG
mgnify:FL=1